MQELPHIEYHLVTNAQPYTQLTVPKAATEPVFLIMQNVVDYNRERWQYRPTSRPVWKGGYMGQCDKVDIDQCEKVEIGQCGKVDF